MEQLRSIQSSWDTNGDGKVSVEELRKQFDANNDGKLDDSELASLADQLSNQTSYTNKLLSQLQSLEEQSLKHQQEAQSRETTLRRAMEAMDQARADANMLRSRLQNANDVIDQHRREEHEQMAQGHERDRQVAALQKIVDQQAHDLDNAKSEAADTGGTLGRLKRSHADTQNELEEQKRKRAEEQARFQVASEELLREKRMLESKLAPLAQENINLTNALQKQTNTTSTYSSELHNTKTEIYAFQRRVAELEQQEISLQEKCQQYQEIDHQRLSSLTALERKFKDSKEASSDYKKQFEQKRTESQNLSNELILCKDKITTVMNELEATQKGKKQMIVCEKSWASRLITL